jgi:hypothetical protein
MVCNHGVGSSILPRSTSNPFVTPSGIANANYGIYCFVRS